MFTSSEVGTYTMYKTSANDVMILYLYFLKVMAGSRQLLKLFCLFIHTKYEVPPNPVEQRPMHVCIYNIYIYIYKQPVKILAVFYGILKFITVFIKPQNTSYAEPNNCCSHSHILLHQKILSILVTHKPCLQIFLFSGFQIKF